MVLGSIPVLALSIWRQDPAVSGHLQDLNLGDWAELVYISVFGSALATGLFFYNATKGTFRVTLSLLLNVSLPFLMWITCYDSFLKGTSQLSTIKSHCPLQLRKVAWFLACVVI